MLNARSSATRWLRAAPAVWSSRSRSLKATRSSEGEALAGICRISYSEGCIGSMVRIWQTIEVVAQDLARQENRTDAKASMVNLGRNEVLISFVLFGLADVCLIGTW